MVMSPIEQAHVTGSNPVRPPSHSPRPSLREQLAVSHASATQNPREIPVPVIPCVFARSYGRLTA